MVKLVFLTHSEARKGRGGACRHPLQISCAPRAPGPSSAGKSAGGFSPGLGAGVDHAGDPKEWREESWLQKAWSVTNVTGRRGLSQAWAYLLCILPSKESLAVASDGGQSRLGL